MKEEKTNENNKTIILVIILIIILVIGAFFLGMYVVKNNDKGNSEVNNEVNESDIIESIMPTDKDFILQYYWSFEDLYNYYIEPKDNNEPIVINENFGFVKVENNKLMWNVNNNWVNDSLVTEDIKSAAFDYKDNTFDDGLYGVIVTNNNEVYTITTNESSLDRSYLSTITSDIYNDIIYSEYDSNINIDYILPRLFSECEIWTNYYFMSDNKIYRLNNSDDKTLIEYDPKTSNNILSFTDTCGNILFDFTWDFDGYLNDIEDVNDKKINATHIISLKSNNIDYIFIVDIDNNLYSIKLEDLVNNSKLKPYKKIEKIIYNYDDNDLNIDFVDGEVLNIN